MILYLTYNDQPSGVYWSQVTDVVAHLNTLGGPQVRLLALVSARDYRGIRRKIRAHCPDAIVLPMVPKMRHWRSNAFIVNSVCRWFRPSGLIARGPLASWLALRARDKALVQRVCFDARGAYAAEWEEYRIIDNDALIAQFRSVEHEAVHASDFRIAVSRALVHHWRERYGYTGDAYAVIPCTLGSAHVHGTSSQEGTRATLGFGPHDVVLVYAGSTAKWQSFGLLVPLLERTLAEQPGVKVLFLSPPDTAIDAMVKEHRGRVRTAWVPPAKVAAVLQACDVALLVRADTLTNRVASPTKFAEYLFAGMPVLISGHIGDFTGMVRDHGLGAVVSEAKGLPLLERPSGQERMECREFARRHFTKTAYTESYLDLLRQLA